MSEAPRRILVWDWPTRLVHWSLAVLVFFLWWTSGSETIVLHKRLGFALLALVVFRVYWGFAGSETARFSDFVKGPRAIARYLREGAASTLGHNPLGALSVVALMGLLLVESALGLFALEEDGLESGPFASYVSFENGQLAAHYHALVFNILLGFVALHILAVIVYLARGQNLIWAMIGGRKPVAANIEPPRLAGPLALGAGIVLSAALFGLLVYLDQ